MPITYASKVYDDSKILAMLRPYVAEWFKREYSTFTPPQRMAIPVVKEKQNVLISSPTGTGKTLAVFLALLDELYYLYEKGELEDQIYIVYVSPLRALNNDMRRNLVQPIEGIARVAQELGYDIPALKVAVRTSDTTPYEKQKMTKNPPHILITTPESLAISLVAPKFRERLKTAQWIVVDEIHELCGSKRGVDLSLSIERLENLTGKPLVRIGLSATIAPLEEVAKYLVGFNDNGEPRNCKIVDARFAKPFDIRVVCPVVDLVHASAEEINEAIYSTLTDLIRKYRTTLVFTNTRSATERVVYKLRKIFESNGVIDADQIEAHHSSLSRDIRLNVEEKLKKGRLKCVVCVSPESEVLTLNGWKKISDMTLNDNILYLDFNDFKLKPGSFQSIFINNYYGKGYLIETKLGFNIKCTPDHKFLVLRNSKLLWETAEGLKEGDMIAVIRKADINQSQNIDMLNFLPEDSYIELQEEALKRLKKSIYEKYGSIKELANRIKVNPSTLVSYLVGRYPFRYDCLKKVLKALSNIKLSVHDIKFIRTNKRKHKIKPFVFDKYLARFLGFWIAEGSWYNNGIRVFSSDLKLLNKYKDLALKIWGIEPKLMRISSGIYGYSILSKLLLKTFKNIIKISRRKSKEGELPDFIYKLSKESISQFLSGYFDGDGYIEVKNGRVYSAGFVTFNEKYARVLQKLLLQLGIVSSLRKREYDERISFRGRILRKQGTCYTVTILGGEYLRKFREIIDPWRENLKMIKELKGQGYSNRDVIPGISMLLKEIREHLDLTIGQVYNAASYNPYKVEQGLKNISRRNLIKLLEFYEKQAKIKNRRDILNEILFLKALALGDIFFDTITCKKVIRLDRICSLVNVTEENYVINGFICKNSSTSLELGIDIGYIDLVALLSSPKSVSRLLQRVGRSGHRLHRVSLGRLVVVDRDDLVECTVLAKAAMERKIDRVKIPKNALDVLAQHIVAMALERKWRIDEAYKLVRRSYCYHELEYDDFISVLRYLAGRYGELEPLKVYAKIWLDEEEGVFGRKRRGKVRMIYYMNSGTIPDEAKIKVFTEDGRYIGELDEQFYQILTPGDIFVLGGRTYEFLYGYGSYAIVKPVKGVRPTVPSWFSEMLPLAYDSALLVGKFRRDTAKKVLNESKESVIKWLIQEYKLEPHAAENIYQYFYEQLMFMDGIVPSDKTIIIELFEEHDRLNLIFHTLFGRRTNDALSRAYAYILSRLKGVNVRITVTDNGFMLSIPKIPLCSNEIKSLLEKVKSNNIEGILKEALKYTELLKRRFRHCAVRSFMLLRRYMDREKSVHKLQLSAENLLRVVMDLDGFPILKEAYREILEDFMDLEHAKEVLSKIEKNEINVIIIGPNNVPSPFAHIMVVQGYSDIVLMEDRRRLLQKLHERVIEYLKYKSKFTPAPLENGV